MGPTISLNKEENTNMQNSYIPPKKVRNLKKQTIFILDWDDTLMCTYFISLKIHGLSVEEQNIVSNLGKVVTKFLKECSKYGKVIIMTNSCEDWMRKTADNYLKIKPETFDNIQIISTRDKYLKKGIAKKNWKEIEIKDLINKYGDKIENLICASDSDKDIDVFKNISNIKKDINISTIKFKKKPSPLILKKEIEYLNKNLYQIIGTNKHFYLIKEKQRTDDFNFSFGSFLDYIFPN